MWEKNKTQTESHSWEFPMTGAKAGFQQGLYHKWKIEFIDERKVSPSIAQYLRENLDFHLLAKTYDTYLGFTDYNSVLWHCMIFFGSLQA